jgi:hypothetical protein
VEGTHTLRYLPIISSRRVHTLAMGTLPARELGFPCCSQSPWGLHSYVKTSNSAKFELCR